MDDEIYSTAYRLVAMLRESDTGLIVAESCTGGMIASAITSVNGASNVFIEGLVTYSNASKCTMLNIPDHVLKEHGAVSTQTVRAMLAGIKRNASCHHIIRNTLSHDGIKINDILGIAVTGIAGPSGGSDQKPVGTVMIACGLLSSEFVENCFFKGNRALIRAQATLVALQQANAILSGIKKHHPNG